MHNRIAMLKTSAYTTFMSGTAGQISHKTDKKARLTEGPVGLTLWRLSWPMTMGLFSIIVFNVVDTFYIGQLGADQLAAMGFCFPVIFTMGAIAIGLGNGGSSVVSRALGADNPARARRIVTSTLVLLATISLSLTAFMYLFSDHVFALLRAPDHLMPYINQYMQIWYSGLLFLILPVAANSLIRANGEALAPSIFMVLAACIHAVMSPLLIFGLAGMPELGMKGGAIANVLARSTILMFGIYYLGFRHRMMEVSWRAVKSLPKHIREIAKFGIPATLSQMVVPISSGLIVALLAGYGDAAVAGFTIGYRIETLALIPFYALQTGISPFVGQNVGAGAVGRLRMAESWIWKFSLFWGLISLILLTSFGGAIGELFTDDAQIIALTDQYLMFVSFAFILVGVYQAGIGVLNPLGHPILGAALSALRFLVLYVGLAWAFSSGVFGEALSGPKGVFIAAGLSWLIAGIISGTLINRLLPNRQSTLQKNAPLSAEQSSNF